MAVLPTLLYLLTIPQLITPFCEQSYIIICDNLGDFRVNDTSTWTHVLFGSNRPNNQLREQPNHILDSGIMFHFHHTKSLTIIHQLSAVRVLIVQPHHRIQVLNLYDNHIRSIEDQSFRNIPRLKEVYLDKNKIAFLGRSIFLNDTLEVVSFQYNDIESVTTAFYQCKIEWIRLNHNKINYIKQRAFPTNLLRLELSHNLLQNLDEEIFNNLHHLQQLSIEHNKLKTLPDISSMKELQFLHLAFNTIHTVNYQFEKNTKLSYIDLSSNNIHKVDADIFSSNNTTTSPAIVSLAFNHLHDLKFNDPTRKTDLILYGNPWICDCLKKIEKILVDFGHDRSCEFENFKQGTMPVCIENGECGQREVVEEKDVKKFMEAVSKIDYSSRSSCEIHL